MRAPFPHLVLKGFSAAHKRIAGSIMQQRFERKDADLFSFMQSGELARSADPAIRSLLTQLTGREFLKHLEEEFGVRLSGRIDASAFIYEPGDHLLCHDDGVSSRKVAFIYYANTLSPRDGGALALFSSKQGKPYAVAKRITPTANTLVLFPVTRTSHHQVDEVLEGRRITIAGWLHD